MRRNKLEIKVGYFVLLEKLCSRHQKRVDQFGPKFVGPFEVLRVLNNHLIIDFEGKKATVNLDKVIV